MKLRNYFIFLIIVISSFLLGILYARVSIKKIEPIDLSSDSMLEDIGWLKQTAISKYGMNYVICPIDTEFDDLLVTRDLEKPSLLLRIEKQKKTDEVNVSISDDYFTITCYDKNSNQSIDAWGYYCTTESYTVVATDVNTDGHIDLKKTRYLNESTDKNEVCINGTWYPYLIMQGIEYAVVNNQFLEIIRASKGYQLK